MEERQCAPRSRPDRSRLTETPLRYEIAELLQRAQKVDREEDRTYGKKKRGDEIPEERARRETRLAKIQEAKAALEAEAKAEGTLWRTTHNLLNLFRSGRFAVDSG